MTGWEEEERWMERGEEIDREGENERQRGRTREREGKRGFKKTLIYEKHYEYTLSPSST